jgi:hypothetical protein
MTAQLISLLLFISTITPKTEKSYVNTFNKSDYYAALASQKLDNIDNELAIVQAISIVEKDGYEGTLLMTKAGLVKSISEKISLFKSGRQKLEACIKANDQNVELRFQRLMIQENAPSILNYKGDIEKDKTIIINAYKTLPQDIQQCILGYSKKSKVLHPNDF